MTNIKGETSSMALRYDLEIYKDGEVVPYARGVGIEGVNRITFFKGSNIEKKDTKKKGLSALLGEVLNFIEAESIENCTIKLKQSREIIKK